MTNIDVIEMAKQAGFAENRGNVYGGHQELERFAELTRADEREQGQKWFDAVTAQHKQEILAEREACAKVCENIDDYDENVDMYYSDIYAKAIRARGQRSDGASIRSNT